MRKQQNIVEKFHHLSGGTYSGVGTGVGSGMAGALALFTDRVQLAIHRWWNPVEMYM